ncbi:hypothetical protein Tco_1457021 [Tanacetum coccineum]
MVGDGREVQCNATRPIRGRRADYGFFGTMDTEIRRQRAEEGQVTTLQGQVTALQGQAAGTSRRVLQQQLHRRRPVLKGMMIFGCSMLALAVRDAQLGMAMAAITQERGFLICRWTEALHRECIYQDLDLNLCVPNAITTITVHVLQNATSATNLVTWGVIVEVLQVLIRVVTKEEMGQVKGLLASSVGFGTLQDGLSEAEEQQQQHGNHVRNANSSSEGVCRGHAGTKPDSLYLEG